MADVVGTTFNVTSQNPFGSGFSRQVDETVFPCIRRAPFFTKTVRITVSHGFGDRFEREQV
jgi:hypothetical protein